MGSLVPGWDANIGVPRDLVPDSGIDKEPEPEGYFAKLRSHRHSVGGPADEAVAPALGRISAPLCLARINTKQASVQRAKTLSHAAAYGSAGPHKYQFTDWSEELTTLRKSNTLGRSSLGTQDQAHEPGHEGGAAWWRALEVGHLNEHPDAVPNSQHGAQHSTFVPQFTQSKELDFGESK